MTHVRDGTLSNTPSPLQIAGGRSQGVANVYGNGTKMYVQAHLRARVRALCTVVEMRQHMSLQNVGQSKLHALLGLGAPPRNVVPAVKCSRDSELKPELQKMTSYEGS